MQCWHWIYWYPAASFHEIRNDSPERGTSWQFLRESRSAPSGLPRTRAGPAAERPLKAEGWEEEMARLRGQPGGTPFLPIRGAEAVPTPSPQRPGPREWDLKAATDAVWGRSSWRRPLCAALQVAVSPRGIPSPRQDFRSPDPEDRASPLRRGDDKLAPATPAPIPSRRPRPLTEQGKEVRKVLESLCGRPVLAGRLPWCTWSRGWAWATARGAGKPWGRRGRPSPRLASRSCWKSWWRARVSLARGVGCAGCVRGPRPGGALACI